MRLLFTRHGESDANRLHVISNRDATHRLTPTGAAQAAALGDALTGYPLLRIYSSPILRAQETAGIVAGRFGLPVTLTPALREFDCGGMEGRGDEPAWAAHREVTRAWEEEGDYERRIPPDGDSFNDLRNRFLPFIAALTGENQHLAGDILLVSHGALLYQMLPLVLTNVDREFIQSHPLGYCGMVVAHPKNTGLVCSQWTGFDMDG